MTEAELKRLYNTTNKFWQLIKGGSNEAAFCMDLAAYTYRLLTEDAKTDEYWEMACSSSSKLFKKYGKSDVRNHQSQMVIGTLDIANEVYAGRYKYDV